MEFIELKELLQENFKEVTKNATHLFETNVDKDKLWNLYLDSFPAGTNEIFRERRQYDCSCCRSFIKNIGNVVVIEDNVVKTIWDFKTNDDKFQPVLDALSKYVKSKAISDVYVNKFKKIGTDNNFEDANGKSIKWDHFYLELPDKFVDKSNRTIGDIQGSYRDTRNVFKRSLDEITEESLLTVLELISQNSLLRGNEWKAVLNEFLNYKKKYDKLSSSKKKELFAWEQSTKAGAVIGRIRNHSMGTLLVDLSNGEDLNVAVGKYEYIVGDGYKRPKPVYSQKQYEQGKKIIIENNYVDSLSRRFATLDDITVNNVLFSNKSSAKRMAGLSILDEMEKDISINPKKFSKVEEISIENFINNVLPTASELEVFLENKHSKNMVSLIAPEVKDSKPMFKWDNGFSWAYTGNITDSSMKEAVKNAGGKVDGVLRFSIQWNEMEKDSNDLDAHCIEPNGNEIYYASKTNRYTTGQLDVDIVQPTTGKAAVENITWTSRDKMSEGTYKFFVRNFTNRGGKSGFRAEIEFDGQIYSFDYNKALRHKEDVMVAEVTFSKSNGFTIKEKLPSHSSSKTLWNLNTNQFVPASIVMYSPNYWNEQKGIGNKHYFFMLKDCINPENPNGFYNEFLKEELMECKGFFAALGDKSSVKDVDDQLSGLGFSSTKRNELIVKVKGVSERVLKVKF